MQISTRGCERFRDFLYILYKNLATLTSCQYDLVIYFFFFFIFHNDVSKIHFGRVSYVARNRIR